MSSASSPIRFPDTSSPAEMTRRGWILVVLNLLIPGSAQSLAGNAKLGRFGLRATFTLWALVALGVISMQLWQAATITVLTSPFALWAFALAAVFYAGLWVVLTTDTLRLVRLVKTGPKARWAMAVLSSLLMIAFAGGAAYAAQIALSTNSLISEVFEAGPAVPPVNGKYNFLLLGGDAGVDRDGLRPDTAIVVSVDAETGQVVTISLPRDLHNIPFVEGSVMGGIYPSGYTEESAEYCSEWACLNTVYVDAETNHADAFAGQTAAGVPAGVAAMMEAAQGVTGLQIQYYALIDMQGFANLIDALGGVDVCVDEAIPIVADEDSEPAEWIEAGCQTLDGYHALWFSRARYQVPGGDYSRIERQGILEQAILDQFKPTTVLTKFQDIAAAGTQVVSTNVPQSMLGYFVELAAKSRALPVTRIALVPENGVVPQEPDFAYIQSLVNTAVYPPPPTESPSP